MNKRTEDVLLRAITRGLEAALEELWDSQREEKSITPARLALARVAEPKPEVPAVTPSGRKRRVYPTPKQVKQIVREYKASAIPKHGERCAAIAMLHNLSPSAVHKIVSGMHRYGPSKSIVRRKHRLVGNGVEHPIRKLKPDERATIKAEWDEALTKGHMPGTVAVRIAQRHRVSPETVRRIGRESRYLG